MIDGGNRADSQFLYSYLKSHGIDHLELIVATHPHEDHIGGLPGVLSYSSADKILSNTLEYDSTYFFDLKEYAAKAGAMIVVPALGEEYPLGGSSLKVISINTGANENDKAIIVRLTHGQVSILFMADAEWETESALLRANAQIQSTILRVGHHGSSTSTSQEFLRAVDPQYTIISVGEGNQFGHPTSDVLDHILEDNISFYRTDLNGTITAISDGYTVTITSERKAAFEKMIQSGEYILPPPETAMTDDIDNTVVYVINTSSGKFHYPTCPSVESMKESNKDFFCGDRNDLIAQGYKPCGSCHP